ncbi:hypothetical protein ACFL27_11815 [candidate division CSSED10-310 bacterium]|uniref:Uncharacterized protein n=1 Tax=candidate division CSSED10-310 bacterium TaxID=2855610 RepID=A0ABV6YXE0_UNCC1
MVWKPDPNGGVFWVDYQKRSGETGFAAIYEIYLGRLKIHEPYYTMFLKKYGFEPCENDTAAVVSLALDKLEKYGFL